MTSPGSPPPGGGDVTLIDMKITVCSLCVSGAAGECHVPGCMFWMCPAPDEEQAGRFRDALDGVR